MAYIGNQPTDNFVTFATQNFSTSATSSYTLSHAVSNENEIALFINNVRQHPGSGKAYTASGTALTLSANTASTDVMYCIFLGRAIQSTVPATNSITAAMMTSGVANGITMVDQWRLTANITSTNGFITANLEQVDTAGQGTLGTAMSVSSGVFSFPSTGIYLVELFAMTSANGADNIIMEIQATTDNSTYAEVAEGVNGVEGALQTLSCSSLIDVTNISNVKVKFNVRSLNTNSYIDGNTSQTNTGFTFIRLGDT